MGLLFSQIGYELNGIKRIILRGDPGLFDKSSTFELIGEKNSFCGPLVYWGECWKSNWWIGDFSDFKTSGEFRVTAKMNGIEVFSSDGLLIGKDILWKETWEAVALEYIL
ncbi:MAG: hypothetical protein PF518_02565 [Spirochaetaceae bacterium]|nr:hypothetical protein [Spirochaetaceae bacterium]